MTRKVLVIGLEVGDGGLVSRWAQRGCLPTFRRLIEQGKWGSLQTTAELLHVSAWPSLYTGRAPGEHGVYYTFQPAPGVQGHVRFSPGQYGAETFWKRLSDAGKRCTVFDAPYTHPEQGYSGAQVFDWGVWAQYLGTQSQPPDLVKRMNRACGKYPLGLEAHDIGLIALDADDIAPRLEAAIDAKAKATGWLMDAMEWDCFTVVFGETHAVTHYCYDAGFDEAAGEDAKHSRSVAVYEALDRGIAEILRHVDDDTAVFVVSADGAGPNRSGWHLLPEVLQRLGYYASGAEEPEETADAPDSGRRIDPVKFVRDLLPVGFRKGLARRLPRKLRDALAKRVDTADIDWSKTKAFCLPTDLEGYIRVNVKGREPMGIVEPGAEYDSVCQGLVQSLSQLINPANGRPAVKQVVRTDEAFPGQRSANLPDVIVVWSADCDIVELESPAVGRVTGHSPDGRLGTHSPPGFVIASGSGIGTGGGIPAGNILDLAPTVLSLLDVGTGDLSGRVWDLS